ncbi:DUF1186 domain-containing protein [Nostoc sp. CMAA1605]|uniref:DUF1186 domain-containing protein n=1 Tax=Nostoc sp. CMAA1605 TaxID=2055159 RepID=UPI001F2AA329|nr:DUF1186 domain-containing protein [Nostoc sp. CMAA1605]MCF4970778.1 DUF1186 domain-containing protein [Nostoc sp. CMAA1605]
MQLAEILAELENNTGTFPRLALERAIEEREAITPVLLSTLENLSNNLEELLAKEDYIFHIYALYLLAQFREPLAYPVIIKFFSVPGEATLDITGDVVTEDLARILASVSGGDIEPVKQLIENPNADVYVRGAAVGSLLVLVAQGVISRAEVIEYYGKLFSTLERKDSDYILTDLVSNSALICAVELKEEIDKAFAEDLIDLWFIDEDDVNDALEIGIEMSIKKLQENPHYSFIESVISEMENWSCFQQQQTSQGFDDNSIIPEILTLINTKQSKTKAKSKKKRKMQEQSRKKNRSQKK